MFESRVVLTPPNPRALLALLDRDARRDRVQFAHRLIWTLFADAAERERDFLFLVERDRPFTAIVRSARPPVDGLGGTWTIATRPFAPVLHPGQRLRFRLRAVAATWTRRPDRAGTHRQDVIMAAWKRLPEDRRTPEDLERAAEATALAWLAAQGDKHGFTIDLAADPATVAVLDYDCRHLPTGRSKERITWGAVTYEGLLTVRAVEPFLTTLYRGLGVARGFGNGLLQIAPAPPGDGGPPAGSWTS